MKIIQELKSGCKKAFKTLYDKYHRRVYFFALKSVHDRSEAEDLSQSIFMKIWENRSLLSERHALETQVFRIARGVVIDYYRAKTTQQQILGSYHEQIDAVSLKEDVPLPSQLKSIEDAIKELPARRQEVFKLSRFSGLTYEEIAEELSISKNTVHVHITQALSTLRKKLAG